MPRNYVRKTYDEYEVQACYNSEWEMVTTELSMREARKREKEYRQNCPGAYRVVMKRVKIAQPS